MSESIKKQTLKGVAWSGLEKAFTLTITFVVNIIMARLLTPSDYGVVGIIAVFVSFSQLFIDGGFTTALISKVDRNDDDYKTVFVFNFLMSVLLYALLFFAAPYIQAFYAIGNLCSVIRIYCLMLVISSFSAIQITKFTIAVDFRTISKISIPTGAVSGVVGIGCAYFGLGVWSIVAQQLTTATLRVVFAIFYSKWFPKVGFSKKSFKDLFRFSSNLIVSSLIDKIYTNSYPLFIGKFFPPATLGYYARGDQFGRLPAGILEDVFNRVTFPLMSKIQEENEKLRTLYCKYIKLSSFLIFPIMMLVVVLAEPIVKILLTDKWIDCVIYMQIISMAMMMNHICTINRNLLYVKQHSDYALKLELIKKLIAITIFIVSTRFGILGVCIGQLIYGMLAPSLNSFYTEKLIGLSFWRQLKDYIGLWAISVVSAAIPLWLISEMESAWFELFVGFAVYSTLYLFFNYVFKMEAMRIVMKEGQAIFDGYGNRKQ